MLLKNGLSLLAAIPLVVGVAAECAAAPSKAAPGLMLEAAYAVPTADPLHYDAYLVINNMTNEDIVLTGVQSSLAGKAEFHKGDETPFPEAVRIPLHAELYMKPGGVHVGLSNMLAVGKMLPLEVEINGRVRADVSATVVMSADDIPDHHDYRH